MRLVRLFLLIIVKKFKVDLFSTLRVMSFGQVTGEIGKKRLLLNAWLEILTQIELDKQVSLVLMRDVLLTFLIDTRVPRQASKILQSTYCRYTVDPLL